MKKIYIPEKVKDEIFNNANLIELASETDNGMKWLKLIYEDEILQLKNQWFRVNTQEQANYYINLINELIQLMNNFLVTSYQKIDFKLQVINNTSLNKTASKVEVVITYTLIGLLDL